MIADQSNKVNVMAGRIYGTLRPAEAMGNRDEDFVSWPNLRPTCRQMWRTLCRNVLIYVAPGRDMGAHSGNGKHVTQCSYLLVLIIALVSSVATAQAPQVTPLAINVMPMPATVTVGAGRLMVPQTFSVAIAGYSDPKLERTAQRFL